MTWTVADVMTKEPVTVGPRTPFKTCADLLRIHEISAIPVVAADGRLIGIVSEADLLAKEAQLSVSSRHLPAGGKPHAMTAGELMTAGAVTTKESVPLATAASLMFERHLRVLQVVDADNRLVGMVSRSQVLKVFLRSDESIRREIAGDLDKMPHSGRQAVEVDVKEGVVHLRGAVETPSLTEFLCRWMTSVPGVVGVVSHPKAAVEPAPAAGGRPTWGPRSS